MKKIDFLHCRITSDIKRRLIQKSRESGCKNLTEFFEKLANSPFVIIDSNVRTLLSSMAEQLCHTHA